MIILDTNVVSEVMRLVPEPRVVAWIDHHPEGSVWITSITVLEIRTGIELLPAGRRRDTLSIDFERFLDTDIQGRVVAFDTVAAEATARLAADRRRAGRPGDIHDTMIAGIALATGATLATRNTRHFDDLSVTVIDPWTA
jgi:predicted nucleic acid-binding protein